MTPFSQFEEKFSQFLASCKLQPGDSAEWKYNQHVSALREAFASGWTAGRLQSFQDEIEFLKSIEPKTISARSPSVNG